MTEPIIWRQIVAEAIRRRKAEGLTQGAHAAFAGVSKPVIIAFDRGETSLSLGRALAILKVVGLAEEGPDPDSQDAFVDAARRRWSELVDGTAPDAAARQPLGGYAFDYEIIGDLRPLSAKELLKRLPDAEVGWTGWPPFWIPTRREIAPCVIDEVVECWLGTPESDRSFDDPAHSDFWRVSPRGQAYLQRGYQEDGAEVLEPGTVLDVTLPIWRAGETLAHAARLAGLLAETPERTEIRFRATHRGLAGRELASWARPSRRDVVGTHRSRTDEATLSVTTSPERIAQDLPSVVHGLVAPLYDRFDGFVLTPELVEREIADLKKARHQPPTPPP